MPVPNEGSALSLTSRASEFYIPSSSRRVSDLLGSTTNPHNPIPIYPAVNTSFPEPTVEVDVGEGNPRMTVIAIDHLPTLVRHSLPSFPSTY
jgi:hypothetical protein